MERFETRTRRPDQAELATALADAAAVHHEYEQRFLDGFRDGQWPGFYSSFVLGRLGRFARASDLACWLQETPHGSNWPATAAAHVLDNLGELDDLATGGERPQSLHASAVGS